MATVTNLYEKAPQYETLFKTFDEAIIGVNQIRNEVLLSGVGAVYNTPRIPEVGEKIKKISTFALSVFPQAAGWNILEQFVNFKGIMWETSYHKRDPSPCKIIEDLSKIILSLRTEKKRIAEEEVLENQGLLCSGLLTAVEKLSKKVLLQEIEINKLRDCITALEREKFDRQRQCQLHSDQKTKS